MCGITDLPGTMCGCECDGCLWSAEEELAFQYHTDIKGVHTYHIVHGRLDNGNATP